MKYLVTFHDSSVCGTGYHTSNYLWFKTKAEAYDKAREVALRTGVSQVFITHLIAKVEINAFVVEEGV